MELEDCILNLSDEEESFEDDNDVKMNDIEEGELVEKISKTELEESSVAHFSSANPVSDNKKQKRRNNKRKNKRKRVSSGPKVTDINRFVLDACKRLRERKSYLIWTAVGCLGVSALSDLIKEVDSNGLPSFAVPMVDAIQTCGGQKTADGRRFRTGGGILWSILKVRDPNAYKEIMKKGKEFEKQFKQAKVKQELPQNRSIPAMEDNTIANSSDGLLQIDPVQNLPFPKKHDPVKKKNSEAHSSDGLLQQDSIEQSNGGPRCASVHDRIRMPVTYDDLFEGVDEEKDSEDPSA